MVQVLSPKFCESLGIFIALVSQVIKNPIWAYWNSEFLWRDLELSYLVIRSSHACVLTFRPTTLHLIFWNFTTFLVQYRFVKIKTKLDIQYNKFSRVNDITYSGWSGGQAKRLSTSFSPITITNVGYSHQDILIFCFNHFATLV